MGVTPKLFSSSSYDSPAIPNPNPENFKIKRVTQLRNFVVAWIKYPDCTNYEGSKIFKKGNTIQTLVDYLKGKL